MDREQRKSERTRLAEQYFEEDLRGQRRWYGEKASELKNRAQLVSFVIIVAGAAIAFLGVFADSAWVLFATGALGAVVTVAKGWEQIARYHESWMAYRIGSERLKRELRLYVNGAGAYRAIDDEEEAYLTFVESVETAIAEEQQIYWQDRGNSLPSAERTRPSGEDE